MTAIDLDVYCPDFVRSGFDIVAHGQSLVLGTAVVLGLAAVVLYRWWIGRRR